MANGDNAASGGLLVILGIIVALIAVYGFYHYNSGGSKAPTINIHADAPAPAAPAAPSEPAASPEPAK